MESGTWNMTQFNNTWRRNEAWKTKNDKQTLTMKKWSTKQETQNWT